MSGKTYNTRCNEITKGYYFILKERVNSGISKANVYETIQQDGQSAYFLN